MTAATHCTYRKQLWCHSFRVFFHREHSIVHVSFDTIIADEIPCRSLRVFETVPEWCQWCPLDVSGHGNWSPDDVIITEPLNGSWCYRIRCVVAGLSSTYFRSARVTLRYCSYLRRRSSKVSKLINCDLRHNVWTQHKILARVQWLFAYTDMHHLQHR